MSSYKNQLQEYLQKASQPLPVYKTIGEGPQHMPKFKSSVIVNEVQYDCPLEFQTIRAAEHAVAQIALERLVNKANPGGTIPNVLDSGLSKNMLQEYTQKMNLELPFYTTRKSGPIHSPTFCSTVEIGGVSYSGGVAATKKEAESRAAQKALLAIQAHACNAGAQMALASTSGSQLGGYSGIKRNRNLENPFEGYKDANCKGKAAMILKDPSAVLVQERGRQAQDPSEEYKDTICKGRAAEQEQSKQAQDPSLEDASEVIAQEQGKQAQDSSEGSKDTNCKGKVAMILEGPSIEDASAALVREQGRQAQDPSEEYKDTNCRGKATAVILEAPSLDDASAALVEDRGKQAQDPSEKYKDTNCKGKAKAMILKDPYLEDASAAPVQEWCKQTQIMSCMVPHGQMKEGRNGAYQDREWEREEVLGKEQDRRGVAVSRTLNMTDGREDEGKGQTHHKRRKNRKNKKAHYHGHRQQ